MRCESWQCAVASWHPCISHPNRSFVEVVRLSSTARNAAAQCVDRKLLFARCTSQLCDLRRFPHKPTSMPPLAARHCGMISRSFAVLRTCLLVCDLCTCLLFRMRGSAVCPPLSAMCASH